ncbi:hypothetical protein ACIQWR_41305 [Streptomyces sp. NPDC098789]|uniref:hypothetical protein n=1 Tax=Streptomyces sp. NPDC098789 TaxID=3366098 RepID=UPI0038030421
MTGDKHSRQRHKALLATGAVVLAISLAACDGGAKKVDGARPSDGWSADANGNRNKKVEGADEAQKKKWSEELLQYAQCLRKNGFKEAKDPVDGAYLDQTPDTPEKLKAQEACKDVLKGWGTQ